MTTFDLAEVREFAADLDARMDRCDNGEGMECANLENSLRHYAKTCCEFREKVIQWARAVFTGRAALDMDDEVMLLEKGAGLYHRAVALLAYAEETCFVVDASAELRSALWELYLMFQEWVTPRLAVGPSARQGLPLDPAAAEMARQRIKSLPPLPANWQPEDPRQQTMYRKLKTS